MLPNACILGHISSIFAAYFTVYLYFKIIQLFYSTTQCGLLACSTDDEKIEWQRVKLFIFVSASHFQPLLILD